MTKILWALGNAGLKSSISKQLGNMIWADHPYKLLYLGDVLHNRPEDYHVNFGVMKSITWPIPGSHDWHLGSCKEWKIYWNGRPCWYSRMIGDWKLLMLDSESPCDQHSFQWDFVKKDIEHWRGPIICCLHRPLTSFSISADHSKLRAVKPIHDLLKNNVTLFLSAHERNMMAIRPNGLHHQLIVGAGGGDLDDLVKNDQRLMWGTCQHGALRLTVDSSHCYYEFRNLDNKPIFVGEWTNEGVVRNHRKCKP